MVWLADGLDLPQLLSVFIKKFGVQSIVLLVLCVSHLDLQTHAFANGVCLQDSRLVAISSLLASSQEVPRTETCGSH